MIYGSISFALFISTGSLAIPAVLAVLFAAWVRYSVGYDS